MSLTLNDLVSIAMSGTRRVGLQPSLTSDLYIATDPQTLANSAGVDPDTYALARMMISEGSGMRDPKADIMVKIVTAQTCMAQARRQGVSILRLLTGDHDRRDPSRGGTGISTAPNRRFGRQGKWVAYAASSMNPTELEIAIAKAVIAGSVPALATEGTHFLSPWGPGATQAGAKLKDFEQTITDWAKEGSEWIGHIPGVDSFKFMAFKRTNKASALAKVPEAMAVVNAGLRGEHAPTPWNAAAIASIAAKGSGIIGVLALFGALGLLIYRRFYG